MCSTVILGSDSRKLLAENYDYLLDHGLVAVNLKGSIKENGRQAGDKAIRWEVRHGSVSFNQFSLELPVSGMNDKGLAIALSWHHGGDFGEDPKYARLSALQWIQYQLDVNQTIDEVVASLSSIRPKKEGIPLHYTLLDAKGNSLLLEFIDGNPIIHKNKQFPFLTNSTYHECLTIAQQPSALSDFENSSSQGRFLQLYQRYHSYQLENCDATNAFKLLELIKQADQPVKRPANHSTTNFPWETTQTAKTKTVWNIVFSPSENCIWFKTQENQAIRKIDLSELNFEKSAKYQTLDINTPYQGNVVGHFIDYKMQQNRNLLHQSTRLIEMPEFERDALIQLIDQLYQTRQMQLS